MKRLLAYAFVVATLSPDAVRADALVGPLPTDVTGAFPPRFLPLSSNGRVAFFGADIPETTFVRTFANGREIVVAHEKIASADEGIYLVAPGALVAGEPLVISSRCPTGCGFTAEWAVDERIDELAPVFDDGHVQATARPLRDEPEGDVVSFVVNVAPPNVSDDGDFVLLLAEGDGVAARAIISTETDQREDPPSVLSPGGEARTECYRVRAVDVAGNETVHDDEVCVDLDPTIGAGCAQTSAGLPCAAAAVLLVLRRRRSR